MSETRRNFLKTATVATALSRSRILGANDRIQIGGIGTGGRCTYLLSLINKADSANIAAVCDAYEPRRKEAKEKLAPGASEYVDYRQLLERKEIDAVVIGSPDHWHVPMTIDAVQAGKDVYVEKPVSHSIEEGERLEKAVAATKQIVQVGYQQRSWDHFKIGREIVASGRLGKISLILVSWYQDYFTSLRDNSTIEPQKLDWKRFLGSAPDQPFNPLRFTRWRWFWDFGGGHLTDLFSHYGDVVHWYMGENSPTAAQAMGGRNALPEFECPDTISAAYEYPGGFNLVYNGTLVGSLDGGNIIIRGSRAMMKINRDGFNVYQERMVPFEKTNYPDPEMSMRSNGDGTVSHMANFLECIRSRKTPNADVKSAVAAARVAHLGNIAYRKGVRVTGNA